MVRRPSHCTSWNGLMPVRSMDYRPHFLRFAVHAYTRWTWLGRYRPFNFRFPYPLTESRFQDPILNFRFRYPILDFRFPYPPFKIGL